MTENRITTDLSASFTRHLRLAERSPGTTENHPRHLFARVFYRVCRDAAKPADVLSHVCMDTARIYLAASGAGQCCQRLFFSGATGLSVSGECWLRFLGSRACLLRFFAREND